MRKHYKSLMNSTVSSLEDIFLELGANKDDQKEKQESLKKYAEGVIGAKAREESGRSEEHMIKKFEKLFKQDSSRDWNSDKVEAAAKNCLHIPLMLFAGLVAIRLEDRDAADGIQYKLDSAFLGAECQKALKDLESPTWAQIQSSKTLITPIQCKELWKRFVENGIRITNQVLGDLKREQKKKPKQERFLKVVKVISPMLAIAAANFKR